MARISTYALDSAINDNDKLIGTDAEQNNRTKNFSLSGIADYTIDRLIDPDATDFHIPVFNQGGVRITDSIISQDSSVSNGTAGTTITISGNLSVTASASIGVNLTVVGVSYLQGHVYANGNVDLGDTPSDIIKQYGTLELLAPIKDSTGTIGNNEQVLVSNAEGKLVWENYQGSGLEYQSPWNAATNVPDLTAIVLDDTNTGKYWVVSIAGTTNLGGITDWSPGDWAIVSQDDAGTVFWGKIDNSSVDGVGVTDKLAVWTSATTLGFAPITISGDDVSFVGNVTAANISGTNTGDQNLAEVLAFGNTTSGTDIEITAGDDIKISDSSKLLFGNGFTDFEIYHDGTGSFISDLGTGNLEVRSNLIKILGANDENMILAQQDNGVRLFCDNSKKFETTAVGATVTGSLTVTNKILGVLDTTVTGVTQVAGNNSTLISTTAYADAAAAAIPIGNYLPLTGGNLTGDLTIDATDVSKSKFNIVGDRTKPSVITLEGTDNDSNWQVGDRIGGIDFYSADGSGRGAGIKGSINYIVTSTSGGPNALTIGMPGGGGNNEETFRFQEGQIGIKVSNPEAGLHIRDTNAKVILQMRQSGGATTGKTAMFTGINNALKFSAGNGEGVTLMELAGQERDISVFGALVIDNGDGQTTTNNYLYTIEPSARDILEPQLHFKRKINQQGSGAITYMKIVPNATTGDPQVDLVANLHVSGGSPLDPSIKSIARDIEITGSDYGYILQSPDGTKYRIKVANGGTLSVAAV